MKRCVHVRSTRPPNRALHQALPAVGHLVVAHIRRLAAIIGVQVNSNRAFCLMFGVRGRCVRGGRVSGGSRAERSALVARLRAGLID